MTDPKFKREIIFKPLFYYEFKCNGQSTPQ